MQEKESRHRAQRGRGIVELSEEALGQKAKQREGCRRNIRMVREPCKSLVSVQTSGAEMDPNTLAGTHRGQEREKGRIGSKKQ